MQLSVFPANQDWMCCLWLDRTPKYFRTFRAPGDDKHDLVRATEIVEAKLRGWLDHLCRIEGRTVRIIGVRTVEREPLSKIQRLNPQELFEVFQRLATWCHDAEIIPCNALTAVTKETEYQIKLHNWTQWGKRRDKLQPIRVGILAGFAQDPNLPALRQDIEEIGMVRMERQIAKFRKMIKAFFDAPAGKRKQLDNDFADGLFVLAADIAMDSKIPKELWDYKNKWITQILKIAEAVSRHNHRKLDGMVAELEFPDDPTEKDS